MMGPSGAGKSTLTEVLVGFVALDAGTVTVGGVDLREADGDRLRRLVRWAPQDPHLFPTTLAANLRIAAPDATDEELVRALRAVGGRAWLDRLPQGLQTPLGEQGERCSGGERQRVGLARALLAGGDVVVLDEPASQLPPDEAITALRAVLDADPSRGALLITHRSEEASLADRTVHLTQGRTRATRQRTNRSWICVAGPG
jgi:ATP-binding cassette, subfamily C, bacterial CydC